MTSLDGEKIGKLAASVPKEVCPKASNFGTSFFCYADAVRVQPQGALAT